MLAVQVFANDNFNYSANVALDPMATWTVASHIVNLDYQNIIVSNSDIGVVTTTLTPIISTTPTAINYTYTLSANAAQTQSLFVNTVDPAERVLIIQTKFTSNTGLSFNANNVFLHIKNNF